MGRSLSALTAFARDGVNKTSDVARTIEILDTNRMTRSMTRLLIRSRQEQSEQMQSGHSLDLQYCLLRHVSEFHSVAPAQHRNLAPAECAVFAGLVSFATTAQFGSEAIACAIQSRYAPTRV